MNHPISSSAFADTKPHYELLDGLRGVAALLVVFYHIFEGFSFAGGGTLITVINHGYLAVDFFFILSGFVIGYAYDDRWKKNLTLKGFFKRRLIRLHPMIVMGAVIGCITFFIQGGVKWDGTQVATSAVMLALLLAMFFIPAYPGAGYDVRGNGEMFSLNGPSWSLFFEYIGNLLYALFIHRLGNKALTVLVILLGLGLSWFALSDVVGYGMIGVGWTLDGLNFLAGKRISEVNRMAELGVQLAHIDGGVPNIRIEIPEISARTIGGLLYFFEKACGISGYILGVNPFDQPGVEAYKKNMFALLDKPGYEEASKAIKARL